MTPPIAPTGGGGARREDAPASKPTKKTNTTEVDRLKGRLDYLLRLGTTLKEITAAHLERGRGDAAHALSLKRLDDHAAVVVEGAKDAISALFALKQAKWVPVPGRAFSAGQEVALKEWFAARFTKHGAYTAAEIKKIRVVSVHGDGAKVQTLKGEALGLVPTSVLVKL